jgi:glycosyltransferase involved in cell wall biosynthesis
MRVPRLSIGLPVYNGEKYIAESLDALLGQTYEDFELIISDNASRDATADICRTYERRDGRVRYVRQTRNLGAAGNHWFLVREARGSLFKWAAADDLYARDLVERCVEILDAAPDVVLAHSYTAAVDDSGRVTQALEYPLDTDSPRAPARFRSLLFGTGDDDYGLIRADDQYGVMRTSLLRRVRPQGSYYHSDRTLMAEIALFGRFRQVPDWLYFRRDHAERPQHASPTVRGWCSNLDPRRANRLRNPTARLLLEYIWGYASAVLHAPLSFRERAECYRYLAQWLADRAVPVGRRVARGSIMDGTNVDVPPPSLSLNAVVSGRGGSPL